MHSLTCPKCGEELTRRESLPGKLCCDRCRKFYDEGTLARMAEELIADDEHDDGDGYDDDCEDEDAMPEDDGGKPPEGWYRDDLGRLVKKGRLVERNLSEFSLAALACGVLSLCLSVIPYVNVLSLPLSIAGIILARMLKKRTGFIGTRVGKSATITLWCSIAALAIMLVTNIVSCQLISDASAGFTHMLGM